MKKTTFLRGLTVAAACIAVNASALSFQLDEFTGGDSTVGVTITQNGSALDFALQITKPAGASASDITGFFGHIGDESLLSGLSISGVKFNNSLIPAPTYYSTFGPANSVDSVHHSNGDVTPRDNFDFGFFFGASNGLDSPPINAVSFTLSHSSSSLSEALFSGQYFAARLQPLNGNDSSKLEGNSPTVSVPDAGLTVGMLGWAMLALAGVRRKFKI